jgi:hypothetical protein
MPDRGVRRAFSGEGLVRSRPAVRRTHSARACSSTGRDATATGRETHLAQIRRTRPSGSTAALSPKPLLRRHGSGNVSGESPSSRPPLRRHSSARAHQDRSPHLPLRRNGSGSTPRHHPRRSTSSDEPNETSGPHKPLRRTSSRDAVQPSKSNAAAIT